MSPRRRPVRLLGLAGLAGLGVLSPLLLSQAGAQSGPATAPPPPPTVVESVQVRAHAQGGTVTALASVAARDSVVLKPEVAGRVQTIHFRDGQAVAAGAPLVRLDDALERAQYQQAQAQLTLARATHRRTLELFERGFVSPGARDETASRLAVAEADLALAHARLARRTVVAPFAGHVGLRRLSVGAFVKDGDELVRLDALDPLQVDFQLPERFLSQAVVGQALTLSSDALPGQTFQARVVSIAPALDAGTRTLQLRAELANPAQLLRPGMFVRLRLARATTDARVRLPEAAVVPAADGLYVFRIDAAGLARRTRIEAGERDGAEVEVLGGLSDGDEVVTAGHHKLRDGLPVRRREPPA